MFMEWFPPLKMSDFEHIYMTASNPKLSDLPHLNKEGIM